MKRSFVFALLIYCSTPVLAQDPEFPKEFIMHVKLHNGMVTNFHNTADQYVGGIQLVPQYTFVPRVLRGGIIVDGLYTGKKLQAAFGPTVSLKLKTVKLGPLASAGNIHLSFDHLWGTEHQRMVGGGIHADALNWVVIGLTAHRDYNLNTWWFQAAIGIRVSKVKKEEEDFNKKHK